MKSFLFLALLVVVVGCSNKEKTQRQEPIETVEETPPVIDQAREQRVDQLMMQVGNVHTPFSSELITNAWCGVENDVLTPSSTEINHLRFDRNGAFVMVLPDGLGSSSDTRGAWSLQKEQLTFRSGSGESTVEEVAVASLARGPEVILLKLAIQDKPSRLYRDCDL